MEGPNCAKQIAVGYFSFAVLNSCSMFGALLFSILYFKDPYLSQNPGKLISSMQICQFIQQASFISAIPAFSTYFKEYPTGFFCKLSAVTSLWLEVYLVYAISMNIEILLQIKRNPSKESAVRILVYHICASAVGFSYTLYFLLYGDCIYDKHYGCIFDTETSAP